MRRVRLSSMVFMGIIWAIYFYLALSNVHKRFDSFDNLCKYGSVPCSPIKE